MDLKERAKRLKSEEDQAKGEVKQIRARLKKELGADSTEEAERILEKLKKEERDLSVEVNNK